jgi:hypothetical protein
MRLPLREDAEAQLGQVPRLPADFMFQIFAEEFEAFKVGICDLKRGRAACRPRAAPEVPALRLHRARSDHGHVSLEQPPHQRCRCTSCARSCDCGS